MRFRDIIKSNKCLFIDIPPVEYSLTATASGYSDISHTITVPKNNSITDILNFQKIITLEPLTDVFEPALSTKQKIQQITTRKLYKLVDNNAGVYYITKDWNSIEIQSPTETLWTFDFNGTKKDIFIQSVRWDEDTIWLKIWDQNYLYHLKYKQLSLLEVADITYIKKHSEYSFLINSNTWIYTYTPNTHILASEENVDDFIVYDEEIISLTQQNSKSVIQTKSKILFETNKKLTQIYLENNQIYLEDEENNIYTLEWLE